MAKKPEPSGDPAAAPPPTQAKREALDEVLDAIDGLLREDKREVLRAAASFHGIIVPMDLPKS